MTPDQLGSLIERLRLCATQVSRGFEVPAAGQTMQEAATALEAYARLLAERASGDGG